MSKRFSSATAAPGYFLDRSMVAHVAPSAFSENHAAKLSPKYAHLSSASVMDAMLQNNFAITYAAQAMSRKPDGELFAKHMVRFRHQGTMRGIAEQFELILTNSHDGTSAYTLRAGFFRFVCMNGLVVGDSLGSIKVTHRGANVADRVVAESLGLIERAPNAAYLVESLKARTLSEAQWMAYGRMSARLMLPDYVGDEWSERDLGQSLMVPRRLDDMGDRSLWLAFNIAQENAMRGGVPAISPKSNRVIRVRPVRSIDRSIRLNVALWNATASLLNGTDADAIAPRRAPVTIDA